MHVVISVSGKVCSALAQLPSQIECGDQGTVTLGNNVFLNQGCFIFASESVSIGDFTRLADVCFVFDTDFHAVDLGSSAKVALVTIGRTVWIGSKATLLPGCSVGDHSVIGAGSVVTGAIPDRAVAVGNPARVISRFDCPDEWMRS
jgi:acetyltransferase-like isoleucine patch superfamily enzyme